MSAQPSPRTSQNPSAPTTEFGPLPGSTPRGDAARAQLTVAPDLARRRLRARLLMWGVALVTVASLFTLVAFHVFAAQSAFALERLSKERTNEQLRYERLREQVARLSSAQTVIEAARAHGMVPAPSLIPLQVSTPAATSTVATIPPPSSSKSYANTKPALNDAP